MLQNVTLFNERFIYLEGTGQFYFENQFGFDRYRGSKTSKSKL